jgi:hypothetical protein
MGMCLFSRIKVKEKLRNKTNMYAESVLELHDDSGDESETEEVDVGPDSTPEDRLKSLILSSKKKNHRFL